MKNLQRYNEFVLTQNEKIALQNQNITTINEATAQMNTLFSEICDIRKRVLSLEVAELQSAPSVTLEKFNLWPQYELLPADEFHFSKNMPKLPLKRSASAVNENDAKLKPVSPFYENFPEISDNLLGPALVVDRGKS